MDTLHTPDFRIRVNGDRLLLAPARRPDDWREISVSQLDRWAAKQWRENAFQPTVKDEQK